MSETVSLRTGSLLQGGKYRIRETLGRGGFGITYLAVQESLHRRVAIKEFFMTPYCERNAGTSEVSVSSTGIKTTVDTARRKFVKEAQTIAALDDERVIRIYDIFEENGTAYYVMEYIAGGSLADLVRSRGRLPQPEAVGYACQIAEALGYIHKQNILHLDIKPSNLMFRKGKIVLIDFGVSKHYDEEGVETTTSNVALSPGYASVEQYQAGGVSRFAPSSDTYSLGAVLYYMLTGERPPEATELPSTPLSFPDYVGQEMRRIILKAMAADKNSRYQSAEEFMKALKPFQPQPSDERTRLDDTKKPYRGDVTQNAGRSKTNSTAIIVVALCVVAGLVGIVKNGNGGKDDNGDEEVLPEATVGTISGHGYVDLGVSVKWATCNVGADNPEDYGDYFAWGETSTKDSYDKDNSKTWEEDFYWDIGGNADYDAARANWGGAWRMPTKEEFDELLNSCEWEWTTRGGRWGYEVSGNGGSIFLPAAGWRRGTSLIFTGDYGSFWSSTPYESDARGAWDLYLFSGIRYTRWSSRYVGRPVRPVAE